MIQSPIRRRVLRLASAAAGASLLTPRDALSQAAPWPSRTIRIVVAFAPGGLTDGYARLYADQLATRYGQPVVVENRPGAGGIIAIEAVTKSAPDGYTLLFSTSSSVWQNRVLYRKLPFDLARDITPIAIYPSGGLVMALSEKVPVRTYAEFIEYARKNHVVMGSYGPASFPHLLAEQMNKDYGLKMQIVHYKGESPMWLDLATSQTHVAVGSYQAFAAVMGRGIRPIAATGQLRCPKLPDVPTLIEQGNKSELVQLVGGLPLSAPTGVPEDILRKLAAVAVEGSEAPKAKALREAYAIPDKPVGLEETRRIWREVAPLWIRQAEALGIKLD